MSRHTTRAGMAVLLRILPGLAGMVGLVAAWWALVAVFDVASFLVPTPPQVAGAVRAWPGHLAWHAWVTVREAGLGFALAVATGLPVGAVLATSRHVAAGLMPSLLTLAAVPKPALAPVLLVTLGFGLAPKIVMVWAMCLFPITLATHAGLTQTPADLAELARALCASRLRTLWAIRLPAAVPHLFVGVKQALPLAVIGAVVAELFGGVEGLGYVIHTAGTDAPLAFAAIALLAAMTITLHSAAQHAQMLCAPWIRHTTS
ncbi:ABC transporter permease [Phytohabitans sp. ZYX-F-186]|uniref:ABC transporter permease n=1 Tax=Phytohabitans maris TaxID=3071409 RepID=A0ABU0ZHI5_9ACTN|nr:ABC transporter permease [Phytohabitans sp. ZYX-F-186]MDQ7905961.1 ABC transporter permease [Phytohabitans sp. ZYX-F-186]